MKKILDHKIGDYLYEKSSDDEEPFTAGRIVAMSESSVKKDTIYVLLQSDDGECTIYSCLQSYYCPPRLVRFIPRDNLVELLSTLGESTPDMQPKKKVKERKVEAESSDAVKAPEPPPLPEPTVSVPPPVASPPPQRDKAARKSPSSRSTDEGDIRDNIFDTILGVP